MLQLLTASAGQVVAASIGGIVFGSLMAVGFLVLLPRYVRLWNRRFTWRAWHRVGAVLAAFVLLVGVAVLGVCRGLQKSADGIASEIYQQVSASPAFAGIEDDVRNLEVRAEPVETVRRYLDAALADVSRQYPLVASQISSRLEDMVASSHEILDAEGQDLTRSLAGLVAETWRGMAGAWIGGLRMAAIATLVFSQGLFLGLLGYFAYRKNELKSQP